MGMFDYVKVDPKHGLPDIEYQSKDFDCDMTVIRITADGTLEIERSETETVPKAERPHPNEAGILGMRGMWRRVNQRWERIPLHGMFNFYGNSGRNFDGDWYEYDAKFTDGVLVEITGGAETPQTPNGESDGHPEA